MKNEREASRDVGNLKGTYANYFKVGHNAVEFLIDFGQLYHENQRAELYTRIVTSPFYAKELLNVLKSSIDQFEQEYGIIEKED